MVKRHRFSYHSFGVHRRPNILELVYINVCMMDGKSLGDAS